METLQPVFPLYIPHLHHSHQQRDHDHCLHRAPLFNSPGELHVIVDLLNIRKIMALSPDDELMDGLKDHLDDVDREGPKD